MRENGLAAAARGGRPRGPRSHDGTIIPEAVDSMSGTDMTAALTAEDGRVAVLAVDHCSASCVGIHAALHGARHEALEPKSGPMLPRSLIVVRRTEISLWLQPEDCEQAEHHEAWEPIGHGGH